MAPTGRLADRTLRHRRSPRHRHEIRRDRLRDNTWLIPGLFGLGALALGLVVARSSWLHSVAGDIGYHGELGNAQTVLSTVAAAMLTFMAVVFSATLVALQLASGQFSPRVLRTFQRDRRTQVVQGTFLATFVYTLTALAELGRPGNQAVPFEVLLSLVLVGASLVAFVLYVHHISRSIRAVYVIEAITTEARRSIETTFPTGRPDDPHAGDPQAGDPQAGDAEPEDLTTRPVRVVPATRSGVVAAVDLYRLAEWADDDDLFVVLVPPVGAYLAVGQPLLEVYGSAPDDLHRLTRTVDVAATRTMYQDVGFGLRQLVDIAERALSPAVNDPTTAVQALDRIGDLVRRIAARPTPTGLTATDEGRVRVRRTIPGWDAIVELAFEEIRWFGRESIQVSRRLTAIFDDLEELVTRSGWPERASAIARQRDLLRDAVVETYPVELQTAALRPDPMGLGT